MHLEPSEPSATEPAPSAVRQREAPSADEPGVAELVAREYQAVWRFLRRLGVPSSDADDVAQRVFARVLAQSERIQAGSERAYLMRAAFRAALEEQRSNRRWLSRRAEVDVDETHSALPEPQQALERRERLALLDRALARLPHELRAVLTLFEIEGLTFSEIAVALELPRGTVASRVRRAKEQFAKAVDRLRAGDKA